MNPALEQNLAVAKDAIKLASDPGASSLENKQKRLALLEIAATRLDTAVIALKHELQMDADNAAQQAWKDLDKESHEH